MKKKHFIVIAMVLFLSPFVLTHTAQAEGNINFMFGQKNLDSDDWEPVEDQMEFGLMFDYKPQTWPISIAVDVLYSEDDSSVSIFDVEGETLELNLGVRKYFPVTEQFKPYIGGGIAYIKGEVSASAFGLTASGDDSDFGFWVSGGAVVTFAQRFNIGVDFRYSQAEITIEGVDGEAGGTHILAFAGFHF